MDSERYSRYSTWSRRRESSMYFFGTTLFYQDFKKRLLGMEAVFSLVKDSAVRAVHNLIRDLLTAMGRKAVQYSDVFF